MIVAAITISIMARPRRAHVAAAVGDLHGCAVVEIPQWRGVAMAVSTAGQKQERTDSQGRGSGLRPKHGTIPRERISASSGAAAVARRCRPVPRPVQTLAARAGGETRFSTAGSVAFSRVFRVINEQLL
jgi:hypothetical protein